MKTAIFYGESDDLIEVEGVDGEDEFGAFNAVGDDAVHGIFKLVGADGHLRIYALYDACWSFAVAQVDDGDLLPQWPIRITQRHTYSTQLAIDVPDDVKLIREK